MAAPLYMDAVIKPSRSLNRQGLYVLLGVVIALNLMVAVFLLVLGAPPVLPFLGLDVLAMASPCAPAFGPSSGSSGCRSPPRPSRSAVKTRRGRG